MWVTKTCVGVHLDLLNTPNASPASAIPIAVPRSSFPEYRCASMPIPANYKLSEVV